MGKRITIILDDDVAEKLRKLQAKQIRDTSKAVSFSSVINKILKKSF